MSRAGLRNASSDCRVTVLVTGGAGYIGSHTCKALARAGYLPVSYDNLSTGNAYAVKWGPLEIGDLADRTRLDGCLSRYRPQAVIHFAASGYVGESMRDPGKYYRNNVAGTLTLLEAMRDSEIDKLVFSSSCAVYGVPDSVPIRECTPQLPISPYGNSKLMVERILADFRMSYGLKPIALRYFNAAGADQDCEIGEDHDPETHVIPLILNAAAGQQPAFPIFGNSHPTPDGTCIRDYIHVTDLADAHVRALARLAGETETTAYNLGTGLGTSVAGLIEAAQRITGRPINVTFLPPRAGDPPMLVCDAELAKAELSWRPHYSEIDDILRTAWAWHVTHQKGHQSHSV